MAFLYPKWKHRRQLSPEHQSNYKGYKPFLQEEFACHCVYCRTPDTMKGYDAFGVEHYLPKSTHPELELEYSNLYYACNSCNSLKGDLVPTRDLFIPNPCDHIMWDHLRCWQYHVEGRSQAGRFTIELLNLNNDERMMFRKAVIDSIAAVRHKLASLRITEREIREKMELHSSRKLNKSLIVILNAIDELENSLLILQGERRARFDSDNKPPHDILNQIRGKFQSLRSWFY
ncbi:MAG: HNH endonuclease [Leptospirales bacterium]|nr:HNH endonuclease [Leptospirales bacterium]